MNKPEALARIKHLHGELEKLNRARKKIHDRALHTPAAYEHLAELKEIIAQVGSDDEVLTAAKAAAAEIPAIHGGPLPPPKAG